MSDNEIAKALQTAVPLVHDPWGAIGARVGASSDDVLHTVRGWTDAGKLREISAVLEGAALGYESALCAGRVGPERLDEVGAIVNACPTVTHNYVRDNPYDLWFTIAVPESIGLDAALTALAREAGVARFHALPRTATFKIAVRFDLETLENASSGAVNAAPKRIARDARAERIFRALQTPLPLEPRPFLGLARAHDLDEDELLAFAREHLGGAIRRYVATFRHRALGVRGNAMLAMAVPPDELASVGARVAENSEVSHCYARASIDGFPYTLYAMVHGPDEAAARASAAVIAGRAGDYPHVVLVSTRELKKTRLRYFLPELDAWWSERSRLLDEAAE